MGKKRLICLGVGAFAGADLVPPAPAAIDERLQLLLSTEQRLEARLRDAEADARTRLAEARERVTRATQTALEPIEADAKAEEAADERTHEAALDAIRRERDQALARLDRLGEAELDALARRVLARLFEAKGGAP